MAASILVTSHSLQSRHICLSCAKPRKHTETQTQQQSNWAKHQSRVDLRKQSSPTGLYGSGKFTLLSITYNGRHCMQLTVLLPTRTMSTKSQITSAINQFVDYTQKKMLSRLKIPHLATSVNQPQAKQSWVSGNKAKSGPLVYFSDSNALNKQVQMKSAPGTSSPVDHFKPSLENNASSFNDVHQSENGSNVQPDVTIPHESSLNEELNYKSNSQYDYLIEKVAKDEVVQEAEPTLLSSVKTAVEMPVNSFFSFISQSNLFKKGSTVSSSQTTDDSQTSTKGDEAAKSTPDPPVSLLENLYQFIPYMFSSSSAPASPKKDLDKELDEAKKIAMRIQHEKAKIAQKVEINNRTRYLIQSIRDANNLSTIALHVLDLKNHLLRFPDTRIAAVKENAVREIIHVYRTTMDEEILPNLRMTLALLGAVDPPKQKGIRVLCIDGGGCRGVLAVEILRRLMTLSGKPIHEMFDYICGVSTGAILAFLLGLKRTSINDVEQIYRSLGSEVFQQNRLVGTGKLIASHAYYSTETLQKILKTVFGDKLLIETAADEDSPKCSAVSTLVNRLVLKPFVWRNYSIVPGTRLTHWPGTCRGTMWEAVRASSAAPGYFEEFKKNHNIHQDGGLLTNNPTGVALNECHLLWPNAPIQCVVSVGTGRFEPTVGPTSEDFLTLKDKLLKVVDSATSVSEVHTVMYDLLPNGSYYRFNPFIREQLQLDDFEEHKLDMLVEDAHQYIELNDYKFKHCVDTLTGVNQLFAA